MRGKLILMLLAMSSMLAMPTVGMSETAQSSTSTAGNQADAGGTDVGIWYCTYYGDEWVKVGGMGYAPTLYRPLCSDAPNDYRTYNAADTAVIDFHLRQIANAKIDFILLELTPGGLGGYRPSMKPFVDNARITAQRVKLWNDHHSWKIRYAIAAGSHPDVYGDTSIGLCMEKEAEDVYQSFISNPEYGGPANYYNLNGKPLLVYWGGIDQNKAEWASYTGDKTYGDKFSMRYASDVRSGSYGWNIYDSGTVVDSEVEVVSPGWGHYGRAVPPYVSRRLGDFYRNCWHTVLSDANPRPQVVMVTAFNDYLENTAVWTADTSDVTDADKWYGHDERPHPWMYWDITVGSINILRGSAACKIVSGGTGQALDALDRHNGEEPYIWDDINAASQKWQVIDVGDGRCKIVNNYTGQALDISKGGASVCMRTDVDSPSQRWKVVDIGGGLSKLVNAASGKALDLGAGPKWRIIRSWKITNDSDAAVRYGEGWSRNGQVSGFLYGDCHTSNAPGSYAEYTFVGTGVQVIGDMDVNHGRMDIWIDGKLVTTVDAYSPTCKSRQPLYTNTELTSGLHTIRVVISEKRNPKSTGDYQLLDAFGSI